MVRNVLFCKGIFVTINSNRDFKLVIHEIIWSKSFKYISELSIIEGTSPNGTSVTASIEITTNQGRKFLYNQTTISDGSYKFAVPYTGSYKIIVKDNNETIISVENKYII